MTVRVEDIIKIVEGYFPLYLAQDWDNPGLQLGWRQKEVKNLVLALDLDKAVLKYALDKGADMIITHHPLFFKGVKSLGGDFLGQAVRALIKADISLYAAHTNLDAGEKGINQYLAEKIGLNDIRLLDVSYQEDLFKLGVYVPKGFEHQVREAINQAGAGHIGNYSDCSFRAAGWGTFRPGPGTDPFIGQQGELEEAEEYRLETVVPQHLLSQVLGHMLKAHPYEEVAYDLFKLHNQGYTFSMGRMGMLPAPLSLPQLAGHLKECLELDHVGYGGDTERLISKVAIVSGGGSSFLKKAKNAGCDVLITGDLRYHDAKEAEALGIAVIDAGHEGTEKFVPYCLQSLLASGLKEVNMLIPKVSPGIKII